MSVREGAELLGAQGDGKGLKQLRWGKATGNLAEPNTSPRSWGWRVGGCGRCCSVLGALQRLASPPTFCSVEAETGNRQCCDPGLEIGPDSLVWSKRLL